MTDELHIAIIINPDMPAGWIANTVGAIGIGLGASTPQLAADRLTDSHGRAIEISANRPVPVLQADTPAIRQLLLKALETKPAASAIVPFPAFARKLHAYADYRQTFPERDLSAEEIDGLGLTGPTKWVRSLTGSLKLLR
ncbi:DUF2000 domain-containing protein [Agrobacterium tumefaciens]|uniref:DUF2000 domain-containing protein n=1 Tax=Agrobacterium tumefaciens TaxID=358 RepID=UPI00287D1AF4|nr:DUF2000 domain-containing protein [Agrobacterium tumefaciens]MDS7597748.1 DUF2000 domain-containing protein [Agrobacterium tumefaciens]